MACCDKSAVADSDICSQSYIASIAKTSSKKIVALICSMKFLLPEVALYIYKPTNTILHELLFLGGCSLDILGKL